MSVALQAPVQTQQKQKPPAHAPAALAAGALLQRQCAYGGTPGLDGECAACRARRLQCKAADGCSLPGSALARALRPPQSRVMVGPSHDPLEQEANRVATQVLAAPNHAVSGSAPLRIQRSAQQPAAGAPAAPASVDRTLACSGAPLAPALRQEMERHFSHNFSQVRVHTDSQAAASAQDVGALAYTVGGHIVFRAGQFRPETAAGRHLIAHELAHVVQQDNALQPFVQRSLAGCQDLLSNQSPVSLISGTAVHRIIGAHFKRTVAGARDVVIPGASAGPLRSQAICGDDATVINPQVIGGMAGAGLPDLARVTPGGILQVAEIKPAAVVCLVDGEEQLLRYIDQGNAQDAAQASWRASLGVTVVAPILESVYSPPNFMLSIPGVARAELRTAWCTPGLLAYTVSISGEPIVVPVPQPQRDAEQQRLREAAARRALPIAVAGTAVVATVAGRALWRHFWRVVVQRFAIRGAAALALSAADGPLPFGELISLGMAIVTIGQIAYEWNDLWSRADQIAAEAA